MGPGPRFIENLNYRYIGIKNRHIYGNSSGGADCARPKWPFPEVENPKYHYIGIKSMRIKSILQWAFQITFYLYIGAWGPLRLPPPHPPRAAAP